MDELTFPARAAADAFNVWRNRPGRSDPVLVMEALTDAAVRAYNAGRDDEAAARMTEKPARRTVKGDD